MEFALIAPIFFGLVFAIVNFSLYVLEVQVANQSAQAAGRWAVAAQNAVVSSTVQPTTAPAPPCPASPAPSGMKAAAQAAAGPFAGSLSVTDVGGTATTGPAIGSYYCQVTVTVPYTGFAGFFGIGPRTISASAIDYVT